MKPCRSTSLGVPRPPRSPAAASAARRNGRHLGSTTLDVFRITYISLMTVRPLIGMCGRAFGRPSGRSSSEDVAPMHSTDLLMG